LLDNKKVDKKWVKVNMLGDNLIESSCYIQISIFSNLIEFLEIINKKMYMIHYTIEIKNKNESEIIKEFYNDFTIKDILCSENIINIELKRY